MNYNAVCEINHDFNFYRLRFTDIHGNDGFSDIINVSCFNQNNFELSLFPNPSTDATKIRFNSKVEGPLHCLITDPAGRIIIQKNNLLTQNNEISIETADLSAGVYFIEIIQPLTGKRYPYLTLFKK